MKCWWCGVRPERIDRYELAVLESVVPERVIEHVRWPCGDDTHVHAEKPPTAEALARQAYEMLNARIS